jgi:predicted RNase H-like HicB family nuclease
MATDKARTILCVDNGQFLEFCLKLTESYSAVYYCVPSWKNGFPRLVEARIGTEWKNGKMLDTFEGKNFFHVEDLFDYIDRVDVIFFADSYHADLQVFLSDRGYKVFGNKKAEELEMERWDTQEYFKSIGMDVGKHERVVGVDALKKNLKASDGKDRWVKVSKYRRIGETFNGGNYEDAEQHQIAKMIWEEGPLAKTIEFIIEENIDCIVEEGVDMFSIDGKYPSHLVQGVEKKSECYVGKFTAFEDLSKGNRRVLQQIAPLLKNYKARGFFSTEVRTTKDGKNYFIDPCMRLPNPPNCLYQEMYTNLGDIIFEGASGTLVEPKADKKCGIELVISSEWFDGKSQSIKFPKEFRNNIKLENLVIVDGNYYCMNLYGFPEVGSIVATGNTFDECKKQIEEICKEVKGTGLEVDPGCIDETIEMYDKMVKLSK